MAGCVFAGQSVFWWRVFGWFGMGVRERNDLGAFFVCGVWSCWVLWLLLYIGSKQ